MHEPDLQRVHDGRMTPNAAYGARFSAFSACRDARARNTLAARGKLFRNTESRYQTPCWPKIGKWLQWLDRRSLKDYRKVPESRQGHTSTPGAPARRWANCHMPTNFRTAHTTYCGNRTALCSDIGRHSSALAADGTRQCPAHRTDMKHK